MKYPNLNEERKLWRKGFKKVAGLDEAGRGPLAGPVTAAAVTIRPTKLKIKSEKLKVLFKEVKDSKKLTQKKREELYDVITKHPAIKWGIGRVSQKLVDKINIKNAAEMAMEKAINKLKVRPDFLLIDGSHIKNSKLKAISHKLIVKADEKVFSCSCASILAKVTRDRIMGKEHKKYPQYGFNKHKGYPTKFHRRALKKYGPCLIHRRSFSPVKNMLK